MRRYITAMSLVFVCCLILGFIQLDRREYRPVWAESRWKIVIDAGHGGIDGGAQGISGLLEKDVNLSVAQKCALLCPLFGIQTVMTRNADCSIDDGSGATVAARKADDIHRRVEIANSVNGILVSIHMNSFPDSKYHGAQCFYSAINPSGPALGACMQSAMKSLDADNGRVEKAAEGSIYLMKHVVIPAVIVECGFLSNTQEEQKLKEDNYRKQLALAICAGAVNFYSGAM